MFNIPVQRLTYSRKSGGPMVAESSDLEAEGLIPRGSVPPALTLVGVRHTVHYGRADHRDVYDAGHEDIVARVYVPIHPAHWGKFPELHLIND